MPVVAIIGGIASAAAGAAAFGAATGLAAVAAGLSVVGGVATALGAITGNKKLMKFGMIAGLGGAAIGGLSSLASNAGAGSAYSVAPADVGGLGLKAGGDAAGALSPRGLLGSGLGEAGASTVSGLPDLGGGSGLKLTGGMPSLGQQAASLGATDKISAWAPTASAEAASPSVSRGGVGDVAANGSFRSEVSLPGTESASGSFGQITGMLGDFGKYLGKNPELTKIGMGALSAMSQSRAEESKIKAQQKLIDDARARYNASITSQRQSF